MPVQRDSSVIHFTDTGSGEPIVLSHGFLMDATMFDRATAQLTAAGLRVIAVDARGFGATVSDPGEPFTYWDLADDIASVLDELDITGPVIVGGMSQGGYTALRFALRYPERTRALVLASTTARANTVEESAQYRAMATAWTDPAIPLEPQARALAPLLIGGTDADQEHWIRRWLTDPDRSRTTTAWHNLATRDELTPRLPEITCPALVLRGHADQAGGTADDASALAEALPGTHGLSTVIAGTTAGHGVWWTHAGPVATAVTRFVDQVRQSEEVSS
ncbi:alpha/beta fold hydrolase [Nocardia caishijiensis]|uniref:Pimeloyl-ACP methyl ester carboxylesterase n=1 Tax=Nocardia caishijiensis TaxID=184756 RepID=A0ABQ6YL99_9NOCA|nr:alpha/beta hydrolase [Nocardia caishijiensis]KAF0846557.1 pimeloyl-ACP methyl ester carboxylesterase [Nocardia caishijiensis]